jgi:ankyrin repeat protein
VQECGADARAANEKGVTPVLFAAQNGHAETVRALVHECGADATVADKDGDTPVSLAS